LKLPSGIFNSLPFKAEASDSEKLSALASPYTAPLKIILPVN